MTAQAPDLIRFEPDGELRALQPLDDLLWERGIGCRQVGWGVISTANWRGYVATFLVRKRRPGSRRSEPPHGRRSPPRNAESDWSPTRPPAPAAAGRSKTPTVSADACTP